MSNIYDLFHTESFSSGRVVISVVISILHRKDFTRDFHLKNKIIFLLLLIVILVYDNKEYNISQILKRRKNIKKYINFKRASYN